MASEGGIEAGQLTQTSQASAMTQHPAASNACSHIADEPFGQMLPVSNHPVGFELLLPQLRNR